MVMLGGELCTTISVWISGTMEPGGGTTPPAVSKSTSGACRGGGTIGGPGGGIMADGPGVGTTSGRLYTVGC